MAPPADDGGDAHMTATSTSARHVTKGRLAYTALRDAIIRCELAPGERVVIDDLARRFDVSIIPVREALRQLESEGLIVSVAHTGTTVAPVSRQLIIEVFALLEGLESVSARAAAGLAEPGDLRALEALVKRMDTALSAGRPGVWAQLNTEFHLSIGKLSRMPMVTQMLRRALDHWDRVRRYFFNGVFTRRAERAQGEHHCMLEQLQSRDAAGIELTMRSHNRDALQAYLHYLDTAERRRT
jgi:DNA-binding GntR family transcriptional regulator